MHCESEAKYAEAESMTKVRESVADTTKQICRHDSKKAAGQGIANVAQREIAQALRYMKIET